MNLNDAVQILRLHNQGFRCPAHIPDDARPPLVDTWALAEAIDVVCDTLNNAISASTEAQRQIDQLQSDILESNVGGAYWWRKHLTEALAQQPAATSETVNVIGVPEFDGLLDHIYEHGTAADGVIEKANAFARAVIARYAPQQPAAVDGAMVKRFPAKACILAGECGCVYGAKWSRALRLADEAAESVICTEGHSPRERQWVLRPEQIAADPYLEDCIAHLEWRGIARRFDAEDGVTVIFEENDMTIDEIIKLASEADPFGERGKLYQVAALMPETLTRFASRVRNATLEECAAKFEGQYTDSCPGINIAAAIRAMKEQA